MLRITLGVIAGSVGWFILWMVSERVVAAIWPEFGVHQAAFQEAIERGTRVSEFFPNSTMLLTHIFIGSIVSLMAGFLAALIADENKRAPFILGILLLAMGLLKAFMSWPYVPVWYHVIFTAVLLTMTIVGGKMRFQAGKPRPQI